MPWISNPKNTVDIIKKYNFTLSKKIWAELSYRFKYT